METDASLCFIHLISLHKFKWLIKEERIKIGIWPMSPTLTSLCGSAKNLSRNARLMTFSNSKVDHSRINKITFLKLYPPGCRSAAAIAIKTGMLSLHRLWPSRKMDPHQFLLLKEVTWSKTYQWALVRTVAVGQLVMWPNWPKVKCQFSHCPELWKPQWDILYF